MTNQKEGESISDFIANLRRISEHCNYGTILEDMLRDRIVCGVRDKRIQQRLLAEPDLKFAKARELAIAAEAATRNSQDLQASQKPNTSPGGESLLYMRDNRKGVRRQPNTEGRALARNHATAAVVTITKATVASERWNVTCARRRGT